MKMEYTEQLQAEYAEIYNKYMTLPDDSKELRPLSKKLKNLEETLTTHFMLASGYTLKKTNDNEFPTYKKL